MVGRKLKTPKKDALELSSSSPKNTQQQKAESEKTPKSKGKKGKVATPVEQSSKLKAKIAKKRQAKRGAMSQPSPTTSTQPKRVRLQSGPKATIDLLDEDDKMHDSDNEVEEEELSDDTEAKAMETASKQYDEEMMSATTALDEENYIPAAPPVTEKEVDSDSGSAEETEND